MYSTKKAAVLQKGDSMNDTAMNRWASVDPCEYVNQLKHLMRDSGAAVGFLMDGDGYVRVPSVDIER
jgi:hypothetical protein